MVAIKDMEMPKSCYECNLTTCKGYDEPWNYCCSVTLTDINLNDATKPSDCPLVEIGTCKDCTNYVVGALDEEICIRGHELIHENFYCADYEKRGNENV